MEADLFAFYGVTSSDIAGMSWRRFQTLARGLIGRDGSKWWVAMSADIDVTVDGVWRPSQAPVSLEDEERRMLAAFGIRKKAPDG